jgi:hypothetical protein
MNKHIKKMIAPVIIVSSLILYYISLLLIITKLELPVVFYRWNCYIFINNFSGAHLGFGRSNQRDKGRRRR